MIPTPPRRRRFAHSSSVLMFGFVLVTSKSSAVSSDNPMPPPPPPPPFLFLLPRLALIRKISPRFVRVELIAFASRRDDDDGDDDDDDDNDWQTKDEESVIAFNKNEFILSRSFNLIARFPNTARSHVLFPSLPLSLYLSLSSQSGYVQLVARDAHACAVVVKISRG